MKSITIYLNADKKAFQVIKPTASFNGDWEGLAYSVTKGNYHSFKVF